MTKYMYKIKMSKGTITHPVPTGHMDVDTFTTFLLKAHDTIGGRYIESFRIPVRRKKK